MYRAAVPTFDFLFDYIYNMELHHDVWGYHSIEASIYFEQIYKYITKQMNFANSEKLDINIRYKKCKNHSNNDNNINVIDIYIAFGFNF